MDLIALMSLINRTASRSAMAWLLWLPFAAACPADKSELTDASSTDASTGSSPTTELTGGEPSSSSTGDALTLHACDMPEPCSYTSFECHDDCPDNQADRACIFTLLRDGTRARFSTTWGEDDLTWALPGDGSRSILVTQGLAPVDNVVRRCELKPADYFQTCVDTVDDPACNIMMQWITAANPWTDCPIIDPFVCPEG